MTTPCHHLVQDKGEMRMDDVMLLLAKRQCNSEYAITWQGEATNVIYYDK